MFKEHVVCLIYKFIHHEGIPLVQYMQKYKLDNYKEDRQSRQESPADAVKPARHKSMQKLLQFDVFRFISPNSISPNSKV